jgi:hypothetical protein
MDWLETVARTVTDLLNQVLYKAGTEAAKTAAFNMALAKDDSLDSIRAAFEMATGTMAEADVQVQVDAIYAKVTNPKFVNTQEYATILADATPDPAIRPLIEKIMSKGVANRDRRKYVRAIWSWLGPDDLAAIGAKLGELLDANIPTGSPLPYLNMLAAFGESGWNSLPPLNRIPLEKALVEDMRKGRNNAYQGFGAGHLGTWCMNFYPYFSDQKAVLNNVRHLLRVKWDGQQ